MVNHWYMPRHNLTQTCMDKFPAEAWRLQTHKVTTKRQRQTVHRQSAQTLAHRATDWEGIWLIKIRDDDGFINLMIKAVLSGCTTLAYKLQTNTAVPCTKYRKESAASQENNKSLQTSRKGWAGFPGFTFQGPVNRDGSQPPVTQLKLCRRGQFN